MIELCNSLKLPTLGQQRRWEFFVVEEKKVFFIFVSRQHELFCCRSKVKIIKILTINQHRLFDLHWIHAHIHIQREEANQIPFVLQIHRWVLKIFFFAKQQQKWTSWRFMSVMLAGESLRRRRRYKITKIKGFATSERPKLYTVWLH